MFDFCQRVDSRKRQPVPMESLIKAGALDNLGPNRAVMAASLPEALKVAEQMIRDKTFGQQDLFGSSSDNQNAYQQVSWTQSDEWPEEYKLQLKRNTRAIFNGSPYRAVS